MVKVVALREFQDLKAKTMRREGEVFTVSKARYEEIMAYRDDLVKPCEQASAKGDGAK